MRTFGTFTGYRSLILFAIGITLVSIYLFPVYWMVISALKTSTEIFVRPPTFVPEAPTLENFLWIAEQPKLLTFLANSFIIATFTTIITLILGSIGAYAMARWRSWVVDAALVLVLVMQAFPEALLATPLFLLFKQVDLLNTYTGVILATSTKTLTLALVVLRPMFAQVPKELEEAAFVDGCNSFQSFIQIVLPIMLPGLLVIGALCFILAYGQFVYPLSLTTRADLHPATVGLYGFVGAEYADWHRVMAYATIVVSPVVVLFLLLQRRIVGGLTAGALK
ncbi:carbohydrate ABC transporter permease [Hoeflea prorocentri]|uniref:Carbohydrate ABC transporter permease n=1 Tax=Hoeflea prorocentri TaxID=1922333 RepID=A0A9X3ZG72_9HYPH|nr:carbohydrate ABC transporter permease [Hoeflea prorocentri]MCY6379618.1 carbohydrate ABC transporter permease [Hoeflea prorocentri]MDA5397418.1 carbohydrate ABC transporter permease [Hoeflea prorocentri]